MIQQILIDYAMTFGWAIVGCVSMGLGIIIALRMFDWSTRDVDEWALVKEGNMPIAIILGSVIIALGIVISAAISPKDSGMVQLVNPSGETIEASSQFSQPDSPFGE